MTSREPSNMPGDRPNKWIAFSSHNPNGTDNLDVFDKLLKAGFFAEDGPVEYETKDEHKERIDEMLRVRHPAYQFILEALPGEKHGLFAKRSLHLIQGSSGTLKTSFALTMLRAQERCEEFIGRGTWGERYLVVWQDRSEEELERQLDNMSIPRDEVPYVVPTPEQQALHVDKALEQIWDAQKIKPDVMLVEGIDLWANCDVKEMTHVRSLATNVRTFAKEQEVSVIATLGMPKMKPRERYTVPRDRAFGSSAWARVADTVVDITLDEETQVRHLQVLSRTGPVQKVEFAFENGVLVERKPKIVVGEAVEGHLSARDLAKQLGIGKTKAAELLKAARDTEK